MKFFVLGLISAMLTLLLIIHMVYTESPLSVLDQRLVEADYAMYKADRHEDVDQVLALDDDTGKYKQDWEDMASLRMEGTLSQLRSYDIGTSFWYYYSEKCNHNIKAMLKMAIQENRIDPLDADNALAYCTKVGISWRPEFKGFLSDHQYMVTKGVKDANVDSAKNNWGIKNYNR